MSAEYVWLVWGPYLGTPLGQEVLIAVCMSEDGALATLRREQTGLFPETRTRFRIQRIMAAP